MQADDFFRARLDQMIDLRHPLAVLVLNPNTPQLERDLSAQGGGLKMNFSGATIYSLSFKSI